MANGLNIPNNLYTAGAVEFDSRPSTNLFIQYQRQKQARDEALDNYERARIDRINESGLRDQDREGLDNIMLGIKQYYQGNKDAIRRGNTPQNYEYEKMMRDAKNYIGESKERTSKSLAMEKYRQERLKQGRSTTEDFWKDYQAHEMPIRSEGSQSMQLEKYLSQQAPKYDQSKTLKLFSDIKRTPGQPTYKPLEGRPFFNQEIIEERFDENAKGNIAVRAAEAYDSDDGFAYEVQQDYNNPVKRGQLEKIFTEEFQTAPQSMSDFATAKVISQLQPVVTKTKDVRDDKAYQDYMQKYKVNNIRLSRFLGALYSPNSTVSAPEINLSDYPTTEDGQVDITDAMKGVAVNRTKTGDSKFATKVLFNPANGTFTYYDPVTKQATQKGFDMFIQDITTNNPQVDIKFLKGLQTAKGAAKPKGKTKITW
jgi:hypothetical protein